MLLPNIFQNMSLLICFSTLQVAIDFIHVVRYENELKEVGNWHEIHHTWQ